MFTWIMPVKTKITTEDEIPPIIIWSIYIIMYCTIESEWPQTYNCRNDLRYNYATPCTEYVWCTAKVGHSLPYISDIWANTKADLLEKNVISHPFEDFVSAHEFVTGHLGKKHVPPFRRQCLTICLPIHHMKVESQWCTGSKLPHWIRIIRVKTFQLYLSYIPSMELQEQTDWDDST
jgi:hypothetical protein